MSEGERAAKRHGHGDEMVIDRVGHVITAAPTAEGARTAAETALAFLELDLDAPVDDAVEVA